MGYRSREIGAFSEGSLSTTSLMKGKWFTTRLQRMLSLASLLSLANQVSLKNLPNLLNQLSHPLSLKASCIIFKSKKGNI